MLKVEKSKKNVTVTMDYNGYTVDVVQNMEAPAAVKKVLRTTLTKEAKNKVQFVEQTNEKHLQMNMATFTEQNAETLSQLTEQEINDIIEYYMTTEILPSSPDANKYIMVQQFMLGYLWASHNAGDITLTGDQVTQINNRFETMASLYATGLSTWKNVLNKLKPAEQLASYFAKDIGIQIDPKLLHKVVTAAKKGDIDNLMEYKKEMYEQALKNYKGSKKSFWDKALQFERAAMLCWPGTWVRNLSSDAIILGLNRANEYIGRNVGKMVRKVGTSTLSNVHIGYSDKYYAFVEYDPSKPITSGTSEKDLFEKNPTAPKNAYVKVDAFGNYMFETANVFKDGKTYTRYVVHDKVYGDAPITRTGKIADGFLHKLEKLFPNKSFVGIENIVTQGRKTAKSNIQYTRNFSSIKVSAETKAFVKTHVVDSGLLKISSNGLTKYHAVQKFDKDLTTEEVLVELIRNNIKSEIMMSHSTDSKKLNEAYKLLYKMLSDDKFINRTAVGYIERLVESHNSEADAKNKIDFEKGLSANSEAARKALLKAVADGYTLASYDYMHRYNIFSKIESVLKERWGPGAFFVYKQFMPFASQAWNWFCEGLNYSPAGLAKAIIQFSRLETTVERLQNNLSQGKLGPNPQFAEYILERNIGKGVIGSIGYLVGILLYAFGVASIDEEDDTYKLNVGDIKVDISDIFGTQGIMLGIVTGGAFKDSRDMVDGIGRVLDMMFEDSVFNSLFTTFRYSQSLGDFLTYQPYNISNMFLPNFLKQLSKIVNVYDVSYSSGIKGKIERLVTGAIPGIAYAFPKVVDPYTGQYQLAYNIPGITGEGGAPFATIVTKIVNSMSPIDVYPYNVSENEKLALSLEVNKGLLTGNYTINDEEISLDESNIVALNIFYGQLNDKELNKFIKGQTSYKVEDKNGKYQTLKFKQMTDEQKATVISRIMTKNSSLSKIYIMTQNGYRYYATDSEFKKLRDLGITKNVYKETLKLKGFVKIN